MKTKKVMKRGVMAARAIDIPGGPMGQTTNYRASGPRITSTKAGLQIANNEQFVLVSGAASLSVAGALGLNPADSNVFPWLSGICRRYGLYRWKKLRVLYQSACPSTTGGAITLGLMYEREDLNGWVGVTGSSSIALSQCGSASVGPVWGSTMTTTNQGSISTNMVEVDVARTHQRVPWHTVDAATDGTSTDNQAVAAFLGYTVSPTGGTATDTFNVGRIWFDYEIELLHPTFLYTETAFRGVERGGGMFDPARDIILVKEPGGPLPRPLPPPPPPQKPIESDQ